MLFKNPLRVVKDTGVSKDLETFQTRHKLGFTGRKTWIKSKAIYDGATLKIAGHPVMEDWEGDYMHMLAHIATSKKGKVLEVGYGMGISAKFIQHYKLDSHYIIECHPDVAKKFIEDFRDKIASNKIHMLTGFWEDITPLLAGNTFDGILFDTYPLKEEEIHANHFWFFKEAYRLLKSGGVLTYYSDEETNFSEKHLAKLHEAGFTNIDFKLCNVVPPDDCEYWQANTILAPVVTK